MAPKNGNKNDENNEREDKSEDSGKKSSAPESQEKCEASAKKPIRTKGKALSPAERAKILKWNKKGRTNVWIAEQLHRKRHTIGDFMKDPLKYGTNKNGGRRSEIPDKERKRLEYRVLNTGDSGLGIAKEFAAILGVTIRHVERLIQGIRGPKPVSDEAVVKKNVGKLKKKVPSVKKTVKNTKKRNSADEDTDRKPVTSTQVTSNRHTRSQAKRASPSTESEKLEKELPSVKRRRGYTDSDDKDIDVEDIDDEPTSSTQGSLNERKRNPRGLRKGVRIERGGRYIDTDEEDTSDEPGSSTNGASIENGRSPVKRSLRSTDSEKLEKKLPSVKRIRRYTDSDDEDIDVEDIDDGPTPSTQGSSNENGRNPRALRVPTVINGMYIDTDDDDDYDEPALSTQGASMDNGRSSVKQSLRSTTRATNVALSGTLPSQPTPRQDFDEIEEDEEDMESDTMSNIVDQLDNSLDNSDQEEEELENEQNLTLLVAFFSRLHSTFSSPRFANDELNVVLKNIEKFINLEESKSENVDIEDIVKVFNENILTALKESKKKPTSYWCSGVFQGSEKRVQQN